MLKILVRDPLYTLTYRYTLNFPAEAFGIFGISSIRDPRELLPLVPAGKVFHYFRKKRRQCCINNEDRCKRLKRAFERTEPGTKTDVKRK